MTKNKNKTKQKRWQKSLYLHVYNIPQIIKRGEENVLLVLSTKPYLQMTFYIREVKFNGRYLLPSFHDHSLSLVNHIWIWSDQA